MKGGFGFEPGEPQGLDRLEAYCRLCGWALALAHAKAGDAAIISGYCGSGQALRDAIGRFSVAYMDQNEADFEQMSAAAGRGEFEI